MTGLASTVVGARKAGVRLSPHGCDAIEQPGVPPHPREHPRTTPAGGREAPGEAPGEAEAASR